MKKLLTLIAAVFCFIASHSAEEPFFELTSVDGKYGLFYNGELCLYPRMDSLILTEPIAMQEPSYQGSNVMKYYKAMREQTQYAALGVRENKYLPHVYKEDGKYGVLNALKPVIKAEYDYLWIKRIVRFKEEKTEVLYLVIARKGGKSGVIDLQGNVILDFVYSSIMPSVKDIYESGEKAKDHNNLYFYTGEIPNNCQVIDLQGTVVSASGHFEKDDIAKIEKKNNKNKEYAAKTDAIIERISNAYESTKPNFTDGSIKKYMACGSRKVTVFQDEQGKSYGVLDENGNILVYPMYDKISEFNEDGVAEVWKNGLKGYVNTFGGITFPLELFSYGAVLRFNPDTIFKSLTYDPCNTYANLQLANALNVHKNYEQAYKVYDYAFYLARERDEENYISSADKENREEAYKKANGLSSQSTGSWELATKFLGSLQNLVSIASGETSQIDTEFSVPTTDDDASYSKANSKGSTVYNQKSASENVNRNTDKRTYSNYETELIKMKNSPEKYNKSSKESMQRKMKSIRQKWEARGYQFPHSQMENW